MISVTTLVSKSCGVIFYQSQVIFTINFNGTYKMRKDVHLAARHNEILVKTKTSVSVFLNLYTVNSYSSSQNTLRLIYEIE